MNIDGQLSEELNQLLLNHSERWRHAEGLPESSLLRLAVLREVIRDIHAQKSRYLATGRKDLSSALKAFEDRIQEFRNQARLEGELEGTVFGKTELKKRTRLLPDALFTAIEKGKFERYDRQWEAALAAEAVSLGWRFWSLDAWVEISQVEEWHQKLTEQLWPSGIVLFVESSSMSPSASGESLWCGRWILVMNPRFKNTNDIVLGISQWPGTPANPPTPPAWKLLFSPRVR